MRNLKRDEERMAAALLEAVEAEGPESDRFDAFCLELHGLLDRFGYLGPPQPAPMVTFQEFVEDESGQLIGRLEVEFPAAVGGAVIPPR